MFNVVVNGKTERFSTLREAQDNAQIRSWMENSPAKIYTPEGKSVEVDINRLLKDPIR